MKLKLIVFDMAGTTVRDFDNVHEAIQEALSNEDIYVSREDVNGVMGMPKPVAIETLLNQEMEGNEVSDALIQTIFEDFENIMVDFYRNDPMITSTAGAEELFELLKRHHIKVAIDTGFSRRIADTIIERLQWKDKELIDFSVTSDEVESGRPKPDMIFKAMEALGIENVLQVAKVGDTVSDLMEGSAAGCKYVIGITSGAYTREELMNAPHTHLIESLSEIPDITGIHRSNKAIH
jgi:phosphonatase-like hydrolase